MILRFEVGTVGSYNWKRGASLAGSLTSAAKVCRFGDGLSRMNHADGRPTVDRSQGAG
jgi:hypothetical protein